MSYQFDKKESPRKALTRIAVELTAEMRLDLAHPDAPAVHDARRRCKMLRAMIRLSQSGLKRAAAQAAKRRIRKLAHLLSGTRDAAVRLSTFRGLSVRDASGLEARLEADARDEQHRQFSSVSQHEARRAVDAIDAAIGKIGWETAGWHHVAAGIDRSYGRARKAFRAYVKTETDDAIHEWRKRTKDFMYHVRLLRPIRPRKMDRLAKRLDDLADSLGAIHDLIVLEEFLSHAPEIDAVHMGELTGHLRKRCEEHLKESCKGAERIFDETRKEFRERLERWWGIA